jgi:DNA polymerase III delta subunit
MSAIQKIITDLEKGQIFRSVRVMGENAYIFSEMRNLAAKIGFSIKRFNLNKQGPGTDVEAEAMGLGLFGGGTLVWLKTSHQPGQWSTEGQRLFERIEAACDGHSLALILELPGEKKKGKSSDEALSVELDAGEIPWWLARINAKLPTPLAREKMEFLLQFEGELLNYAQWMELWSLGGDLWAEQALGWQQAEAGSISASPLMRQPPAFAFIDAILAKQKKEAVRFLDILYGQSQDPLQLLGLLARNARLLSSVQMGETPEKTPPFVIQKLKKSRVAGWKWLEECSEIDSLLKSSSLDSKALYSRMIERLL